VPHGICAGSEHQGGQHEHEGGQPVQAAVNFVTTMTVDGKNVDLVNYWYRKSMLAGDELIFRLERHDFSTPKTFTLSSYYKQPASDTVNPNNPADPYYWQLVPDILRGRTQFTPDSAWHDHRSEGYWRIAQTFQTRAENNSTNAFTLGLPLEVTFAPVWHSFSDCINAHGKSVACSVEQYDATKELMAHINAESMIWLYEGLAVFTVRKVRNGYHISHDPTQCFLSVNNVVLTETQLDTTHAEITQIQFMCFDKIATARSAFTQTLAPSDPEIPEMLPFAGTLTINADIDHIDMESKIEPRPASMNIDFFVKLVLKPTKSGGFMHEFCKVLPEKYRIRHGIWTQNDANYEMLKSLQITYTNTAREARRPAVANRKRDRKAASTLVKDARTLLKLPPIITAVLSAGETLVPHVEAPSLGLDAGPPAQTGATLVPQMRGEGCPTEESFGLPEQVDAVPRKKKGKVLRFLSASDGGEAANVSDVSTADSGH
jgi:hypothetical protein